MHKHQVDLEEEGFTQLIRMSCLRRDINFIKPFYNAMKTDILHFPISKEHCSRILMAFYNASAYKDVLDDGQLLVNKNIQVSQLFQIILFSWIIRLRTLTSSKYVRRQWM